MPPFKGLSMERKIFNIKFRLDGKNVRGRVLGELYSYDKNNHCFELDFLNTENEVEALPKKNKVLILYTFDKGKSKKMTYALREEDKIIFKLDTDLITKSEIVDVYVYLEDYISTTDIGSFKVKVHLSEIHKEKEEKQPQDRKEPSIIDLSDYAKKKDIESISEKIEQAKSSVDEIKTQIDSLSERIPNREDIVSTIAFEEAKNNLEEKIVEISDNLEGIKRLREAEKVALAESTDSLRNKINDLEQALRLRPRRAPMGWRVDYTTDPYTHYFDNGCLLKIVSYGNNNYINGVGQNLNLASTYIEDNNLISNILRTSMGIITLDMWKKTPKSTFWSDDITVENPIREESDYDWTNARLSEGSGWEWARQKNIVRVLYALGIWSGEVVESLGAERR